MNIIIKNNTSYCSIFYFNYWTLTIETIHKHKRDNQTKQDKTIEIKWFDFKQTIL